MSGAGNLLTVADVAARARELLAPGPLGYLDGGAGDERTLADNEAAWARLRLLPRVLVDVSVRDLSTTVLGAALPHPVMVAPTATHRLYHPDGEVATARGSAAAGAVFCLPTLASIGPAELAAAVPEARRWFQLYVMGDRGHARDVLAAAREHGYEAVVVTVDLTVVGVRDRELRSAYVVEDVPGATEPAARAALHGGFDESLTWDDLGWIADAAGLPLVVKGVLHPDDARLAADHGAGAVVVSNHGGRQLDTAPASADALAAVVDAAGDRLDVLVDGGVRRGTDVLKALALGARAVMVGRPPLWGLTVAGADGVERVLRIVLAELDIALALAGCPRARDLDRSYVVPPGPLASGNPARPPRA